MNERIKFHRGDDGILRFAPAGQPSGWGWKLPGSYELQQAAEIGIRLTPAEIGVMKGESQPAGWRYLPAGW